MQFSLEEHQVMLEILEGVRQQYEEGDLRKRSRGICTLCACGLSAGRYLSKSIQDKWVAWLQEGFEEWPLFSGSFSYTVPAPRGRKDPRAMFRAAQRLGRMWDTSREYGSSRAALLYFLRDRAERKVKEAKNAVL